MSDYGRDTRELPPGDNLMENKQKAKPMKIVQHVEGQESHGKLPQQLHTPSENKEALQAVSKTNKCAYVKDQADNAQDSEDQEIQFKRYTSIITVTKSIRNRENMSLPQNNPVCSSPESKHVETECLVDVYKPGLLCAEQTMWTPLNDSDIVAESSLLY